MNNDIFEYESNMSDEQRLKMSYIVRWC